MLCARHRHAYSDCIPICASRHDRLTRRYRSAILTYVHIIHLDLQDNRPGQKSGASQVLQDNVLPFVLGHLTVNNYVPAGRLVGGAIITSAAQSANPFNLL